MGALLQRWASFVIVPSTIRAGWALAWPIAVWSWSLVNPWLTIPTGPLDSEQGMFEVLHALRPPLVVGPGVGFVLVRPDEQAPTYRDDTRPRAVAIEMTEEDGSIHLANLRSQIARLEALAVLVTIVLATPAAVAAARGLTVSLGLV